MPTVRQRQPEPLHVLCILEGLPNIHASIPTYQVVWHQQTAWQRALAWPATAAAYMPHAGPLLLSQAHLTLDTLHKLWQAGINRLQVAPGSANSRRQHQHRWCECRSSAPKQKTCPLNHILAGNKGCPCRNAGVVWVLLTQRAGSNRSGVADRVHACMHPSVGMLMRMHACTRPWPCWYQPCRAAREAGVPIRRSHQKHLGLTPCCGLPQAKGVTTEVQTEGGRRRSMRQSKNPP